MTILETHGHFERNTVKVGDRVVAYETVIGTIGKGNNQYIAHDHLSYSEGLTPQQVKAYIARWSLDKVKKYYLNPHTLGIDFQRMYADEINVGKTGYDWLDNIGYGFHPGVDINGIHGGDTDFGMEVKAGITGTVVLADATWGKNGGWGNLVIIEGKTTSQVAPQAIETPLPILVPQKVAKTLSAKPKASNKLNDDNIAMNSRHWELLQANSDNILKIQQELSAMNDKLKKG